MEKMVVNEVTIMSNLDNYYIGKLYETFQDKKYIYYTLELLTGGELYQYQKSFPDSRIPKAELVYYAACIVEAFQEMHSQCIAYRDLKPENVMFDAKGKIKIIDLGLAKIVTNVTWTMCGTPDYLAPEIINNQGHDYAVDYWALGVLIFECLSGKAPFFHNNHMRIFMKICAGKYSIPDYFSKESGDIISKLLSQNVSLRLGNQFEGITELKNHKWFGSFDWVGLHRGRLNFPKTCNVQLPTDSSTSIFDTEEEEVVEEVDWFPKLFFTNEEKFALKLLAIFRSKKG